MDFDTYRLPDGRIVPVDASASKGLPTIGFTLKGGKVVDAVLERAHEINDQMPMLVETFHEIVFKLAILHDAVRANVGNEARLYTLRELCADLEGRISAITTLAGSLGHSAAISAEPRDPRRV